MSMTFGHLTYCIELVIFQLPSPTSAAPHDANKDRTVLSWDLPDFLTATQLSSDWSLYVEKISKPTNVKGNLFVCIMKSPELAEEFCTNGLIWKAKRVFGKRPRDRPKLPRCQFCQSYDHNTSRCQSTNPTCAYCSQNHFSVDCPNPTELKCPNCSDSHPAGHGSCKAYKEVSKNKAAALSSQIKSLSDMIKPPIAAPPPDKSAWPALPSSTSRSTVTNHTPASCDNCNRVLKELEAVRSANNKLALRLDELLACINKMVPGNMTRARSLSKRSFSSQSKNVSPPGHLSNKRQSHPLSISNDFTDSVSGSPSDMDTSNQTSS